MPQGFLTFLRYIPIVSLLCLFQIPVCSGQSSALRLEDKVEKHSLEKYIDVLEDPKKTFSIDQVSSPAWSKKFHFTSVEQHNYGYSTAGYWVRLKLQSSESESRTWMVKIINASLEEAIMYSPAEATTGTRPSFTVKKAGPSFDFNQREVKYRYPVFTLKLPPGEQKTYYFYFASRGPLHFPMQLVAMEKFVAEDHLEQLLQGLYFGILAAMIFYNLFLYVSIHDRNYLFYLLYAISFGLLQASINGMAYEFLFPTPSWLADHCVPLLTGTTAILGSIFCANFLDLPRSAPGLYKGFLVLIGTSVLLLLANLWNDVFLTAVLATTVGLAFALLVLVSAIYCLRTNYRPALYLLMAWSVFLIGIILFTLNSFGLLPANFFTNNSIQIGSALDVILLSLALADRINQVQAEKVRIEQEKRQAEESRKMKEQFLASVSHEIRTPMNAIQGFARLLEHSSLEKKQLDYARHIRVSADNLLIIINDILDISKIGAGKISFERVEIKLPEMFKTLLETVSFQVKEKDLKVTQQIDPQIPSVFLGDPVRLHQILLNLLSNAVKFTTQGEVRLIAQLYSEDENQVMLTFQVQDTGIGIPADKLPIIFDSFTQASQQTTRMYGGTGLGLTIVKQLVELQGGQVFVESQENKGSTFTVILPFFKIPEQITLSPEPKENKQPLVSGLLRILVFDDNPVNQLVTVHTLKHYNPDYQIETVSSGEEGIQKLRQQAYDLLLIDLQMPGLDGLQTTQHIRSFLPAPVNSTPIIGLSASVAEHDRLAAIRAGMDDFLTKPFDAAQLLQKFRTIQSQTKQLSESENPFDISHVEKAGLGDREFMIQLMDMFLEKTPEALDQMDDAARKNQWKEVGEIAHKIKSVFICMGLQQLLDQLVEIEKTAIGEVNDSKEKLNEKLLWFRRGCENSYLQIRAEKEKLTESIDFGK